MASATFQTFVQEAHRVAERVGIRFRIATAEQSHILARQIGRIQHPDAVVPVVLQFAVAPGRGAQQQYVVSGHEIGRKPVGTMHIALVHTQPVGNHAGQLFTGSGTGTIKNSDSFHCN